MTLANQRSSKIIKQSLDLAASINEYKDQIMPSHDQVISLIHDYEDILFCSPCEFHWQRSKGKDDILFLNAGLVVLTRQRLILRASKQDLSDTFLSGLVFPSIELAIQLSDINWMEFFTERTELTVNNKRTAENELPDPPYADPRWRPFKKRELGPNQGFSIFFPKANTSMQFYEKLKILPYSIRVNIYDVRKRKSDDEMKLPIHPQMMDLNQSVIGYEALYTIAEWIKLGQLGFSASELLNNLSEHEKILAISRGKAKGDSLALDRAFTMITNQNLVLFKGGVDSFNRVIKHDSVDEIFHKPKKLFSPESIELTQANEIISIRLHDSQSTKLFMEALLEVGLGGKLSYDADKLGLEELVILQPFENVDEKTLEEAVGTDNRSADHPHAGYVYILINSHYGTDLLKIGKTIRSPEDRAQEIFTTGVPGEFMVAYEEHVQDCNEAENEIHLRLTKYRVSDNREFFRIPLKDAVRVVSEVASEVGVINDH